MAIIDGSMGDSLVFSDGESHTVLGTTSDSNPFSETNTPFKENFLSDTIIFSESICPAGDLSGMMSDSLVFVEAQSPGFPNPNDARNATITLPTPPGHMTFFQTVLKIIHEALIFRETMTAIGGYYWDYRCNPPVLRLNLAMLPGQNDWQTFDSWQTFDYWQTFG